MNSPIENLKKYIKSAYESTSDQLATNIIRGHLRSISTDIEDGIAIFMSEILPSEYKILLDPSIHIGRKNNRPDLLIIDSKNIVKAMIEIKANMGWCRDATAVINDIVENNTKFSNQGVLNCEFSTQEDVKVAYNNDVKLFLVSLTDGNCPADKHQKNKEYASQNGVHQFNLFTGWYNSLEDLEIQDLINSLLK